MRILRGLTRTLAGCFLLLLAATPAAAQLRSTIYLTGLTNPVGIVQDPSNAAVQYVLELGGLIKVVQNGNVLPTPFLDLTGAISTGGERGLLGLAFPSNYGATGWFWAKFTNPAGNTVVARFRRSASNQFVADLASRFDLLWPGGERFIVQPFANHNGGHLAFGPDGYLYIGMGDGGASNDPNHNAQNPATLLGKMLRIDVHVDPRAAAGYRVPPDNPFIGGSLPGVLPEIWSFGYRNPWRYSFDDPALGGTGALIVGDVGQGALEEIDYEPAGRGGRNYGWRNREGTRDNITDRAPAYLPLTDPIFDYPRSAGVAVTGGFVYRGSALGARTKGGISSPTSVRAACGLFRCRSGGPARPRRPASSNTRRSSAARGPSATSARSASMRRARCTCAASTATSTRLRAPSRCRIPSCTSICRPRARASPNRSSWRVGRSTQLPARVPASTRSISGRFHQPDRRASSEWPTMGGNRPDVGAAFGTQFTPSGWGLSVAGLPPDSYRLMAFGWVTAMGTFGVLRSVDITVVASMAMSIDVPAQGSTLSQPFHLGGWAIDRAARSGTGVDTVHVWAFPLAGGSPSFVGVPSLGGSRPDVGAFFGAQFTPSGYNMLVSGRPPGTYDIVVFAHSAVTNSFDAAQVLRVTVR